MLPIFLENIKLKINFRTFLQLIFHTGLYINCPKYPRQDIRDITNVI